LNQKLLTWAEHYTRYGFKLFPLPFREKIPKFVDWPNRATRDIEVLKSWIESGYPPTEGSSALLPVGGWAIVTGQASGIVVVDVDGDDGKSALDSLARQHGRFPQTPMQKTPGKFNKEKKFLGTGTHIFFKAWGQVRNSTRILPSVDVRADGGYVVAAPSFHPDHPDGKPYEWVPDEDLEDIEIAECPEWLKALIEGQNKEKQSPSPAPATSFEEGVIPEGQRDDTLTRLAGSMRRWGMPTAAIEAALTETNKLQCRPPLDDEQVRKIARSIGRKDPGYLPGQKDTYKIDISKLFTDLEADTTPIEYIGGIFPRGDISLFFGKEGHGKTIWLDAFTRQLSEGGMVMNGILGKDEPARKIIFFEGDTDVKLFEKRMHEYQFGGNKTRLKYVFNRRLQKDEETKNLAVDIGTDIGYEIIRQAMAQEKPDLVIFDTMQSFHLLDENKMDQMQMLFSRLLTLATLFDCAVVVVHHARKSNPKFQHNRLTRDDAQGSNIFLRKSWTVMGIEKLNTGNRTIHVFSRMKDWGRPEQEDWFGFQIAEDGFYSIYT
jgi:KaiC/GvpD/RAD55 family RecA-like ATPase